MWSKSASLLIVRIKLKQRREFTFPVSVGVIDLFMEALTDIAWLVELILKNVPSPSEEKARNSLSWVNRISPRGMIAASHGFIKDLSKYKGLDVVDVETEDVQVKISLK